VSDKTKRDSAYGDLFSNAFGRATFLFLPAWTLNFPHAWAYLVLTFTCDVATRVYLVRHDPIAAERRRQNRATNEERPAQRQAHAALQLLFMGVLLTCALDHRNGWSEVPMALSSVGFVLVGGGLFVVFLASRANSYASQLVTLHDGHQVISSGPYGLVRHPMYSGVILFTIGTPLALGSWWGMVVVAVTAAVLAGRLLDEERFLATSLAGYREYTQRVRHRLVPLVW
jgi:protein-S-isoprenylcysteine O-methyltransferase Ste14